MSDDSPYPEDAPVLVKYPRTTAEEQGDRGSWPWLPGTVLEQVGPDEWQVCVEARELATEEAGELWYPCAFRDSSELRRVPPDVTVSPPGDGSYRQWIARRDGMILASDHELGGLLGILEELLGQF